MESVNAPGIFAVWESQGWVAPFVEEQYKPDRTILTLSFEAKQEKQQNRHDVGKNVGLGVGTDVGLSDKVIKFLSDRSQPYFFKVHPLVKTNFLKI